MFIIRNIFDDDIHHVVFYVILYYLGDTRWKQEVELVVWTGGKWEGLIERNCHLLLTWLLSCS